MPTRAQSDDYFIGPAPEVYLDGESWVVADETGTLGTFDSRADALAAVEATVWFVEAVARKNPEALGVGDALGLPRWVDAAMEEDMPATAGGQLTADGIDQIVDNLAGIRAAPIVDGAGISDAHASVKNWEATTDAAGYVLAGVRVVGADSTPHLWLLLSLLPGVDARIDSRSIVYGSVAFLESDAHPYTGADIGARLISYALTDKPYQGGLEPHAARTRSHHPRATWTRARSLTMPSNHEKKRALEVLRQKLDIPKTASRDVVRKAVTEHARSVGLEPTADAPLSDIASQVLDHLFSLAAKPNEPAEERSEENPGDDAATAATEPPPAAEERAMDDDERAMGDDETREMGDFESPEAAATFAASMVEFGRAVTGNPEATPEEVMDLMASAQDAIAGVFSPESADDAADGMEAERSATQTAEAAALRSRLTGMEKELATLRAQSELREVADTIDAAWARAKLPPLVDGEGEGARQDRTDLIETLVATPAARRAHVLEMALRGANRPPQGRLPGATPKLSETSAPDDKRAALESVKSELRAANPKWNENRVRRAAAIEAPKRFPQFPWSL